MKKILLIVPVTTLTWGERNAGGVDSVCQLLLEQITKTNSNEFYYRVLAFDPKSKVEYTGVAVKKNHNTEIVVAPCNNKIFGFNIPSLAICNIRVYQHVKEFEPDLVHSHQAAWIIGAYKANKKIATLHSYKKIGRNSVTYLNNLINEKIAPKIFDLITTKYTVVGNILKIELNKNTKKEVILIGNPVNPAFNIERNKIKKNDLKMVTCCIVTRRKQVHEAINILDKIKDYQRSARLTIIGPVGDVEYYRELVELIEEKGLSDCVEFAGECSVNQVVEYYKNSNLAIFLSKEETFGLVPLEMIMSGLPIITTKTGIIADEYEDFKKFESVRIIENIEIDKIKEEIGDLLISDARPASEYVKNKFRVTSISNKYENTYREMLV